MQLRFVGILIAILIQAATLCALEDSIFYTSHTYDLSETVVASAEFTTDNTSEWQSAIDNMSAAGGGNVLVPAGNYYLYKLKMKSDVNLIIDPGATIRPYTPIASGNYSVFEHGPQTATVYNTSITSSGDDSDSTQRFTVDLEHVGDKRNVMVFSFNNANNFYVSGCNIKDIGTWGQSVNLSMSNDAGRGFPIPHNGIIKHCYAHNAEYGYGLVQIQAGKNILFENLSGTGGVTLRIETGWETMNRELAGTSTVDSVYGREIRCYHGQAAVMASPHTLDQGYFDVRNIYAEDCEFAVKIDKGHKESKYDDRPDLSPGTFSDESIIANVYSVYGPDATVRVQLLRYIPCNLQSLIGARDPVDNSYAAPACAPVGNFAGGYNFGYSETSDGSYYISYWDVQATGYDKSVPNITLGDYYDYEDCSPAHEEVWIPNETKNTRATKHYLTGISAPSLVDKGQTATITVSHEIGSSADIHFELVNKETGAVIVTHKTTGNVGTGTKEQGITIPTNTVYGEYLWKVWIAYPGESQETDQEYMDVEVGYVSGVESETGAGFGDLRCYPNPVSDQLNIKIRTRTQEDLGLTVYNQLGKLVYTQYLGVFYAGMHTIQFNTSQLVMKSQGLYIVELMRGNKREYLKVMVE